MNILLLIMGIGFIFFLGVFIGDIFKDGDFDIKDKEDLRTILLTVTAALLWHIFIIVFISKQIIKYIKKIKDKREQKLFINRLIEIYSFDIHEGLKSKDFKCLNSGLFKDIIKLKLVKDKLKFKTRLDDTIKLEINPSLYYLNKIKIIE